MDKVDLVLEKYGMIKFQNQDRDWSYCLTSAKSKKNARGALEYSICRMELGGQNILKVVNTEKFLKQTGYKPKNLLIMEDLFEAKELSYITTRQRVQIRNKLSTTHQLYKEWGLEKFTYFANQIEEGFELKLLFEEQEVIERVEQSIMRLIGEVINEIEDIDLTKLAEEVIQASVEQMKQDQIEMEKILQLKKEA